MMIFTVVSNFSDKVKFFFLFFVSAKTERLAVSFESGTVNLDEALENAKSESLEKMDDLKGAFVGNHQKVSCFCKNLYAWIFCGSCRL